MYSLMLSINCRLEKFIYFYKRWMRHDCMHPFEFCQTVIDGNGNERAIDIG